ncbi:calcium-binding protein [Puniceibacterium confluentis]|uniref:calcium-binding protein n=1 Tax=Puniceibacterium confluentis TaxID=1958944 RepID=UPI0011B613A8|nr:calcium-binding protein [Puniceibacterium confluentis]
MRLGPSFIGAVALVLLSVTAGRAEERDAVRVYMFANSLVHYLEGGADTNVPVWLQRLARADGRVLAVDGQWGTLRDFTRTLPPAPNWSIAGVPAAIPRGRDFASAGIDTVLINPTNFIQYQSADRPYDGDNPAGATPVTATLGLLDWIAGAAPQARVIVYEGWSDMAGRIRRFPPSRSELADYHTFNQGAYQDWYVDYVAHLREQRPGQDISLLPVSSTLSSLMQDGPLADLDATVFYSDDAPHGTANLYFLAALVTYAGLYHAPPPADFEVPDTLHPRIAAHYGALRQHIWDRISPGLTQAFAPTPRDSATSVDRAALQPAATDTGAPGAETAAVMPVAGPDSRRDIPALAMGLNGISDWSTQHPFLDLMKTARPWVGHLPGQWGGVGAEELRAGGHLSPEGWPLRMPPGVDRLEAVLLTDQPVEAVHLRGDYVLRYDGEAQISLTGRASRVHRTPGQISFHYEPGEGLVGVSLSAVNEADPIRNIRILRQDMLPLWETGVLFNPDWIARIRDLRAVRFMDWMFTNGASAKSWEDRPRVSDYTYAARGVPVSVMLALANQIGADPWFSVPHMADDAYVRAFATQVRDTLDPRLKVYVEYSNEVWNFLFPQAHWAGEQAVARWGESETGWMQFYGLRAAQVMDIWTGVFGAEAEDRLVRVISTHTGWPGLEESVLQSPLGFLELGHMPQDSFDAYAVSGYFGHEIGGPDMAAQLGGWLDASEAQARQDGAAQGLRRVALREYVSAHRFDGAIEPVIGALRDGSVREILTEIWPYHADVARKSGLELIMYEGGSHVTAHGDTVNDDRLTGFFTMLNYTPQMAALYGDLLTGWSAAGGHLFNAFVDVAAPGKWGSWGALRHLSDANPRWDALMAFDVAAPDGWEHRDAAAFADGVLLYSGAVAARLEGTAQEDILIGGPGADTLVSGGGADHLNGAEGQDLAILPGQPSDYEITTDGARTLARGPDGVTTLMHIEAVQFAGAKPDGQ